MLEAERLRDLLYACARGDQQALASLYDLTASRLFGLCLRLLNRQDWAEDVLQEAFVQIWYRAAEFDPAKGSGNAWLTSIVRYRALDMLRRERAQPARSSPQNLDAEPGALPDISDDAVRSSEAKALLNCLKLLEESQRNSIFHAYFHGYTHQQVASCLKVPLGTAKTWIRRGLERIRECLGQ